jgi:hypothetical protein
MSGPESFRNHAQECFRLATVADDPEHRLLLLGMAQSWVVLADSAERMQMFLDHRERAALH